jgi:hypothetical protein
MVMKAGWSNDPVVFKSRYDFATGNKLVHDQGGVPHSKSVEQ